MVDAVSKQPIGAKVFDPAKLESMSEPLSVRVEKLKGNARTMIPLPAGDDGSSQGSNWSKEDVKGLEQWLVTDWSGGGMYAITVTDSSMPQPAKHDWTIFYNPQDYPEKVPPTLSAAAAPDRPIAPSQPQQVRPMGSFPSAFHNGLPANVPGQPQTVYVQQPPASQYTPREPVVRYDPNSAALAAADADRRRMEEQLKEMQAQLQRAREEQMQAQHRQELERAEARMRAEANAQNEKFSKLEQMIAALATAATQRPTTDPAIEALKEQNRVLAQQAADERREREAERREREMKEMIQRQAEESRRQMEAMQASVVAQQQAAAQTAALAAASANKGPDPMLMFLQENARQQVEAVKEQARNQTAQMAQMQSYMMNPRDVMAMAKESSNGLDQATRSITSTYQSILEMQRNAVEQILQLNSGGGSETIQLIEKGLERASSMAERYLGGKTKEAVATQQSQASLAQANAAAMQAQAQAMTVQAQMQARQQAGGLNGPQVPASAGPAGDTQVSQTSSVRASNGNGKDPNAQWTTGPVPAVVEGAQVRRIHGRTDLEWFGPILPKVEELRVGVAHFHESLKMSPPRLKKDSTVDGVEPEQAASVILQAAMIVMQQQIQILAMTELLGQGRVADFMDVLLPDASQQFRDEAAQIVLNELSGNTDDDEDEDEEDEGDETGDDNAVEVQPPVKPAKPANGRARA
jgi:hypothetical protein